MTYEIVSLAVAWSAVALGALAALPRVSAAAVQSIQPRSRK